MQNQSFVLYDDGMTGVMTALKPHHCRHLLREQIDDLAFAFVSPRHADNDHVLSHC